MNEVEETLVVRRLQRESQVRYTSALSVHNCRDLPCSPRSGSTPSKLSVVRNTFLQLDRCISGQGTTNEANEASGRVEARIVFTGMPRVMPDWCL